MGQRRFGADRAILPAVLVVLMVFGCDDRTARSPSTPTTSPNSPQKIASLVPAATDLLIAMGAGDRLIAVSNYDFDREGVRGLPRVGDYQTIDWEQLGSLRPDVMILAQRLDRFPAGVVQRASDLHIRIVNAKMDNLQDILNRITDLGDACAVPDLAATFRKSLQARLDAVRASAMGREKVSALIVLSDNGMALAGPGSYLDDLLQVAGGRNAANGMTNPYPSIDREMLRSLDPGVIIQLLPDAPPQTLAKAGEFWKSESGLRAVKDGRVVTITDWYALLPGAHVADLAEKFSAALRGNGDAPASASLPSTTQPKATGESLVPHN
jgi:iron complex transport system substrate-binding protein